MGSKLVRHGPPGRTWVSQGPLLVCRRGQRYAEVEHLRGGRRNLLRSGSEPPLA
jgi:hypothetical protein